MTATPIRWKVSPHQELITTVRAQVADRLAELRPADGEREALVRVLVDRLLDEDTRQRLATGRMPLDPPAEQHIAAEVTQAFSLLGPLGAVLADRRVTNVFINGPVVWVTHEDGSKHRLPPLFGSAEELIERVRDIAARSGADERRFDRVASVRLPDGSRLFATLLSREPSVTIRRYTVLNADLPLLATRHRVMDQAMCDLLTAMVKARKNIVICGGPATGKTTFLRAMAKAIPPHERIVTIEDTDELGLDLDEAHPDCVALQAREANVEGVGRVDLAELVRWALRMSADRVFVGEARGGEVVPLLNCMSQGTDGSMATIHSSTSKQAFDKLMVYAAQSAERLPFESTAPLVATAVHFVVHLAWSSDGHRVVSSVRQVLGAEGAQVISNQVFEPGPDRRAVPAAPLRPDTVDELAAAGFDPFRLRNPAW